jgi:hypothetical protein
VALMAEPILMGIDVDGPSLRRVVAAFDRMPEAAARAMFRANRKLETWLKRVCVRAASQAAGFPQKYWLQALRFYIQPIMANGIPVAVSVWIGTNPVPVHRLGTVQWTRRMKGARVNRKQYAGSWRRLDSKTSRAVMRRTSPERLPIERIEEPPHDPVQSALSAVAEQGGRRYERLLARELNYALNVEAVL